MEQVRSDDTSSGEDVETRTSPAFVEINGSQGYCYLRADEVRIVECLEDMTSRIFMGEKLLAFHSTMSPQRVMDRIANAMGMTKEVVVKCGRCGNVFPQDPAHPGYPDVHHCHGAVEPANQAQTDDIFVLQAELRALSRQVNEVIEREFPREDEGGAKGPADYAHQPVRWSDVEGWIKRSRDQYTVLSPSWQALNVLLDNYRLHVDTGTPLREDAHES